MPFVLSVHDPRSLDTLLARAALPLSGLVSMLSFLAQQTLIPADHGVVRALHAIFAGDVL